VTDADAAAAVPPAPPDSPRRRAPAVRAAGLGLLVASVVLWAFAGFTWRVPAVAVGGVVVARLLLLPLFPRRLRAWLGPLVLAVTFLYLLTQVSAWTWGITAALVGTAVGVVRLPRWRVLAVSVALGAVCAAGLLVSGHESAVRQQLQEVQSHEVDASGLLANDPTLLLSSRAPLEQLLAYKRRLGWDIPWVSTEGTEFNRDIGMLYTQEEVRPFFESGVPPTVEQNAEDLTCRVR